MCVSVSVCISYLQLYRLYPINPILWTTSSLIFLQFQNVLSTSFNTMISTAASCPCSNFQLGVKIGLPINWLQKSVMSSPFWSAKHEDEKTWDSAKIWWQLPIANVNPRFSPWSIKDPQYPKWWILRLKWYHQWSPAKGCWMVGKFNPPNYSWLKF